MKATSLLVGVFVLTACGTTADGPNDGSPAEDRRVEPSTTVNTDASVVGAPEAMVAALVTEAASLEGVPEAQVTVIQAQRVMWNDGSLGCASGGMSYIQVLTPGYWVVLEAAGTEYDYRSADDGEFRRCQGGNPPYDIIVDR